MPACRGLFVMSVALGSIAAAAAVAQSPQPLGGEFQVNAYTDDTQEFVAVAVDDDGDFVVVWTSDAQDGDTFGVFGRRFDSAGTPQGSDFQVNSHTASDQAYPAIGMDAAGDFVVTWEGLDQDGDIGGVFARRFDSSGASQGTEFLVNAFTMGDQNRPAIGMNDAGEFVDRLAALSRRLGRCVRAALRRLRRRRGRALSRQRPHHDVQRRAEGRRGENGDFVVTWKSNPQAGGETEIFARRFASSGSAQGVEFQVNLYTPFAQGSPAIAAHLDGSFVIVWDSAYQTGSYRTVFARRFSSAGVAQGGELQVSSYTTSSQRFASVEMDDLGGFVVAWNGSYLDGDARTVLARSFTPSGEPRGEDFIVNTYTPSDQNHPALAVAPRGDFVVVWDSSQDGYSSGIFAQRFAGVGLLDVDGDGAVGPLTDGVLILRFLFGFTGSTLVSGARRPGLHPLRRGCDRALPHRRRPRSRHRRERRESWRCTDGLLVLRFLFGFTGTTLTSGAVGGDCARCDVATIEGYLSTLI